MGADFLERVGKNLKKSWDHGRVRLGTDDLFRRMPDCATRSVRGAIIDNIQLQIGEQLVVEKNGGDLVARRGLTEVVRISNPPVGILAAIEQSCGVAKGTVERIYPISCMAEISLC